MLPGGAKEPVLVNTPSNSTLKMEGVEFLQTSMFKSRQALQEKQFSMRMQRSTKKTKESSCLHFNVPITMPVQTGRNSLHHYNHGSIANSINSSTLPTRLIDGRWRHSRRWWRLFPSHWRRRWRGCNIPRPLQGEELSTPSWKEQDQKKVAPSASWSAQLSCRDDKELSSHHKI